jgi:hypothetical protein
MPKLITTLLFLLASFQVFASQPTTQSSNAVISQVSCNSLKLDWIKGDGAKRVVFIKEGSAVGTTPGDFTQYSASAKFGNGDMVALNTYVVYNEIGNSVVITNLKQGVKYYIAIFEHDDNGSNTDYLTTNPATAGDTTLEIFPDFSVAYTDSCGNNNLYNFSNKTTANMTVSGYLWEFGDDSTSSDTSTSHSYKDKMGFSYSVKLTAIAPVGCTDRTVTREVKVVPLGAISTSVDENIKCDMFDTFRYKGEVKFNSPPPGVSFNYEWDFDDGTSSYTSSGGKSYTSPGKYRASLVIIMKVNNVLTNCSDTAYLDMEVLKNPDKNAVADDSVVCLRGNNITFHNPSNDAEFYQWKFGDGGSSLGDTVKYTYMDTGNFLVEYFARGSNGCETKDTILIRVNDHPDPDFSLDIQGGRVIVSSSLDTQNFSHNWQIDDSTIVGGSEHLRDFSENKTFDIIHTVTNNSTGCDSSIVKQVNLQSVSAVDVNNGIFNAYPNPSSGDLNIEVYSYSELNLTILDVNGREVMNLGKFTTSKFQLDLNLVPGTYFIHGFNVNEVLTFKIIVK